jgi:hypothetical protein
MIYPSELSKRKAKSRSEGKEGYELETIALPIVLSSVLLVMKTSASSRSITAFHLAINLNTFLRFSSMSHTSYPSSPLVTLYKGHCKVSATLSVCSDVIV